MKELMPSGSDVRGEGKSFGFKVELICRNR